MMMNVHDLAWMKGEGSYVEGDTVEDVARKAEEQGYRPGSQGHSAFLGGFLAAAKGRPLCGKNRLKTQHKVI